ncbi:MAG: hypothetical protein LLG93_15045, partial [Deltaproteobacteria bacterium]|nr:hypothetical protein [Deltaproteobacteria bacterium]
MSVAALLLAGWVSLAGQIVLLRELSVAFYGIELIYLIALGLWLLMAALGTLSSRRRPPRTGSTARLLLLLSLLIPSGCAFIRGSRIVMGGVPGAYLSFPLQMGALLIALSPAAFLSGRLFIRAAGDYIRGKRTLAGAYGIESAGALAGAIATGLAMAMGIQNFPLVIACSLLAAAASFWVGQPQRTVRLAALGASVLLALVLLKAAPLDRAMTRWNHPGLLASGDSPYGRVTVTARLGQIAVFVNDALAFETEGEEAERLAHVAALQHGAPQSILLLGGGISGTLRELLHHRPARIDWVEMDRLAIAMTRPHLPEPIQASLSDPAVHLIWADPRPFLRKSGVSYDLILIGMPEPASGQANRFYTREFFRDCAARLAPGGIVALTLPTPGNIWSPQILDRTASVQRALASVLPETLLLPGEATVLTASRAPLPASSFILEKRLRERGIQTRLVTAPYLRYLFEGDRKRTLEKGLRERTVALNTDLRPVCYPYAVTIWLAKFFPRLALADIPYFGQERPDRKAPWGVVLGTGLLFLTSRLWPAGRRWLLVAAAGGIGIALESLLILDYQAKAGALYQEIGLLLAAFMAGLALGASLVGRLIRGGEPGQALRWGIALIAGFIALGA